MRKRDIARKARKIVRLDIKLGEATAKMRSEAHALDNSIDICDLLRVLRNAQKIHDDLSEDIHYLINKLCDENNVDIRRKNG